MADLLQTIRDKGHWAPVPIAVLAKLLEMAIGSGKKFDKELAMADIIFHADKDAHRTIRDYAKRWGWSKSNVERFLHEVNPEGGSEQKPETEGGTKVGQVWDKFGTKNGDFEQDSENLGTSLGQVWDKFGTSTDYIDRARQTTDKNNNKYTREGIQEIPEDLSGWTPETLPVRDAYLRWKGQPPDAPMMQTIRLLLMPRGTPQGARIPGDARLYNGYSPEEVISAIEVMAMSAHHSAASLVRHVAGLMTTPSARGQPRSQGWMTEEDVRRRQEREPRIKQMLEAWKSPDGMRYRTPTTGPAPDGWTMIYKPAQQ
jgi:hypothetical protein